MPLYKYRAVDKTGTVVESTQVAATREQVMEILRSRGNMPVSVEEYNDRLNLGSDIFLPKVKVKDVAIFCRQFYTMINTGIPIISCLGILRVQTENKRLKKAVYELYDDVQTGMSLADALHKQSGAFPELLVNMVEAGELSGTLDTIMLRMSNHYEKETKLNAKVANSMIYPVILIIAVIGVIVGMLTLILPMFVGMFNDSGVPLPLPTRMLVALSGSIINFWYIHITVIIVALYSIYIYSHSDKGKRTIDGIKLKLPGVGKPLKMIITARFTRTLSTLMSSGITLMQGLEITAKVVDNAVVGDMLLDAREQVRQGMDLATPIRESDIFPPMAHSMIMVGEESGALDEVLEKTADFYDAEVEAALQAIVALLEPVMILVMAVVVGFIVISIFLPMLDMMSTVS